MDILIIAQAAAETAAETESAVSTVLHAIADALPFPWNAVAAAALTAAGAVFAWRRKQTAKRQDDAQEESDETDAGA